MTNSPTPSSVTIAPKPCPFCGKLPMRHDSIVHLVCCVDHECPGYAHWWPINDWNHRPGAGEDVKASPVVPVLEKLEELEAKLRAQCKTLATGEPDFSDGVAAGKQECADDIAQLIKEAKGG